MQQKWQPSAIKQQVAIVKQKDNKTKDPCVLPNDRGWIISSIVPNAQDCGIL